MSNQYVLKNKYAELRITSKKYGIFTVFIDIEDITRLKKYSWWVQDINKKSVAAVINGKNTYIHRFLMNCPQGLVVDHINHNRADNRKKNLRVCTQKENMNNLYPNCKGGKYIFKVGNKFRVQVPKNGKNKHLGMFSTLEEAQKVVKEYIENLWILQISNCPTD